MREPIRKVLVQAFKAGWATSPPFPVVFDNHNLNEAGEAWGRFSITYGENTPAAIGADHTRTLGIINLQVFIPEGQGTKPANLAADRLQSVFRFQRFTATEGSAKAYIEFEHGADGPTPKGTKEGFAQFNISARFRADELPA